MKNNIDKILVTKPEDIKSLDDLEIVLNDILTDFECGEKSKTETGESVMNIIVQMMLVAKGHAPWEKDLVPVIKRKRVWYNLWF